MDRRQISSSKASSCRCYWRPQSFSVAREARWKTVSSILDNLAQKRKPDSIYCAVDQEISQRNPAKGTEREERLLQPHKRLGQFEETGLKSAATLGQRQTTDVGASKEQSVQRLVSISKAVDRRVYDQVASSRNRLSKQLSAKNRYIRHLESVVEERTTVVADAHKAILRLDQELEAIKRLSEVAKAAASYGVDKAEAVARNDRIVKRAESLQKGIRKEAAALDRLVVRKVPVTWYGVASEVKMMGDFDNWTLGFSLSPKEIQDQTFTKFHTEVPLLPGSYKVKFKVDDVHWRLAPEWPTVDDEDGSTNNLLEVE